MLIIKGKITFFVFIIKVLKQIHQHMQKNRNKFIENVLNELKNTSRYLTETYIFDGEDYEGEEPMMDDHDGMEDNSREEVEAAMNAQEIIRKEPIISKIREISIEGLSKYASNPTSPLYSFFKKTLLEVDKLLTDKGEK